MREVLPRIAALMRGAVLVASVVLAGCASTPRPAANAPIDIARDGADPHPPANLEQVPDAEPRVEPIRSGGPNKPYEALGRTYVPLTQDAPYAERGLASWYGRKFHGKRTSSGEPYDMYAMTAAHPTLPIPSYVRVRNPANGREVIVRVNDRGPFHPGRIIDLSYTAALKLDLLRGVAPVEVQRLTFDEIRAGTWRRAPDDVRYARAAPVASGVGAVVVPSNVTAPVAATTADVATPVERTVSAAGVVSAASPDAAPGAGFWLQLGAFRERAGALDFQRKVGDLAAWLSPRLVVVDDAALFRLQAGPYASREEARGAADGVRAALSLVPVIVERR